MNDLTTDYKRIMIDCEQIQNDGMNWFDYLRGYEEGQYEDGSSGRYTRHGIILSFISLSINLLLIVILVCFNLLKLLYRLVWKIILWMTR